MRARPCSVVICDLNSAAMQLRYMYGDFPRPPTRAGRRIALHLLVNATPSETANAHRDC
jgi:hypothetical protein